MASLTVDEANFKSERDVVKEEFRTGVLGPAYGLFYYSIDKDSYRSTRTRGRASGRSRISTPRRSMTWRHFHRTFYRPDNAVVIVAGDFDPKRFDAWVDRYLGSIPKPRMPIPRVSVTEPPRSAPRHVAEHGPNVATSGDRHDLADSAGFEARFRATETSRSDSRERRLVAALPVSDLPATARAKRHRTR